MPPPIHPDWLRSPEIQTLVAAFSGQNALIRFVGGCVRDTLLGRTVKDIDAATPLPPDDVMALLSRASIKAIPTGIQHGTVTAVIGKKPVEITTLRKDVETYGRHAKVEYTDDWQTDAGRRDFTINALYLAPDGELFDYFCGAEDARAGRVRFIGDPAARVAEDYLRVLRFFRFHAHYGQGAPDKAAVTACAEAAPHVAGLSGERIQQEILKLLAAPASYPSVRHMQELGILERALGVKIADLQPLAKLEQQFQDAPVLQKLAILLVPISDNLAAFGEVAKRLKLSNADAGHVRALLTEQLRFHPDMSEPEQKKLLRRLGADLFIEGTTTSAAVWSFSHESNIALAKTWHPPAFPVGGDDLKALGIGEGKRMGDILRQLEEIWEASDYTMTAAQLLEKAKMLR